MLSNNELAVVTNGFLSLQARLIYTVYLIPCAENGEIILDYLRAAQSVTIIDRNTGCAVYQPNYSEVNEFIIELINAGLLEVIPRKDGSQVNNGAHCRLPYRFYNEMTRCSFRLYRMYPEWQPTEQFFDQARFSGLSRTEYTMAELQEFISYWITRDCVKDDSLWNLTFINYLKRKHKAI